DTSELFDGSIQVVVDDDVVGQLPAFGLLRLGQLEAGPNELLRVTPAAETLLLCRPGRRQDHDDDRLGVALPNLSGSPNVDLENNVVVGGRVGYGRAAVVTGKELDPFQEAAGTGMGEERFGIDERVGVVALARPLRARVP